MNFTRFENVTDFLARAEAALLADECLNSLALGICYRIADGYYPGVKPLLAVVEEAGELVATIVQTPPHAPVLYNIHPHPAQAMQFLAESLQDVEVPGIFGRVEETDLFAKAWQTVTSRPYRLQMNQCTYELRQVEFMPNVPGRLRQATQQDFDLLIEWMVGFNLDAFGVVDDHEAVIKTTTNHFRLGNYYIWEDGRPVSVAAKTRESPNGRTVSFVYTPPNLRSNGYATACVAALSQYLLDQGYQFCTLFTDLANPTSNSIYQKIGYKPVANFNKYAFD